MKKFLSLFLVAILLSWFGVSFAEAPSSQNIVDFWGRGGATGLTPPTKIVKVRYARAEADVAKLSSGDVVVWDVHSCDGYAISLCVVNNAQSYAGVLVTDVASREGIGYMAIEGFVLAKTDTSAASTMTRIVPNGGTLAGSFASRGEVSGGTSNISVDVGVLLEDEGSDVLMPVWLD